MFSIKKDYNFIMSKQIAYFAGGCFWCITPIFKIYGCSKVTCGYCGGLEVNPTYELVKSQKTKHRETISVEYDDEIISYDKLIDIFLYNVDVNDSNGQFIDRGYSYTLAIYYQNDYEKNIAYEKRSKLENPLNVAIEPYINFYQAEEYHQDYYLKNPDEYEKELIESGRKKG